MTTSHDSAKTVAQDAAEAAKTQAQKLANNVSQEAASYAASARDNVAAEANSVANALRNAADEMRAGSPQERTLGQIADGIADASDAIRDKDLGQIVNGMTDFARRNPTVFLGGAALLGFAAVRFAKASSEKSTQDQTYAAATPAIHGGHQL